MIMMMIREHLIEYCIIIIIIMNRGDMGNLLPRDGTHKAHGSE